DPGKADQSEDHRTGCSESSCRKEIVLSRMHYLPIITQALVFLIAISVHESAHAWMADRRGDPTARLLGRVSLNPLRHIDPIGTVLMPLLAIYNTTGFPIVGWAKPTPINPGNFKRKVVDDVLTSIVGPVSNFALALLALMPLLLLALSAYGRQIVHG